MKHAAALLFAALFAHAAYAATYRPVSLDYATQRDAIGAATHEHESVLVRGTATVGPTTFSSHYDLCFIQSDTAGLALFSRKAGSMPRIVPGSIVEAAGTIETHAGEIEINVDDVRIVGNVAPPRAIEIEPSELRDTRFQGRLVRVTGRVYGLGKRSGTRVSIAGSHHTNVSLYISARQERSFEPLLRDGSYVRVTGIASQFDPEPPYYSGWQIRPRAARDIQAVPVVFVSTEVMLAIAALLAVVTATSTVWIIVLRRRVATATASLVETVVILTAQQEATFDGILVCDHEGRIRHVNQRFKEMWRMHTAMLFRANAEDLFARMRTLAAHPDKLQYILPFTGDIALTDGRIIAVTAVPLRFDEESINGAVWTFRDVTEREILRDELDRSTRVAGLGRLAASISHEFNNVLMAIQPQAELLRRQRVAPDVAAARILTAVQRGKRTTSEVLSLTRPVELSLNDVDVETFIGDLAGEIRSSLDPRTHLIVDPGEDLHVRADRERLGQVLINLALNAQHAMPGGGLLRISASKCERSVYPFGFVPPDREWIHFEVNDNGIGIAPDLLERIFEPLFSTKKNGGSGLGLAIARQIVTAHHGLIFVESQVGVSTTFHLFMPRGAKKPMPELPQCPSGPIARRHILIVEDDDAVADGLTALLVSEGAEVTRIDRGRDVLPTMATGRPDAVILDLDLPDASGETVYAEIAASYPDMAVIFSSGHVGATDLRERLKHGRVEFLEKPYDGETLVELIAALTCCGEPAAA